MRITNSSNVASIDVEGDNLVVEYQTGRKYEYDGLGYAFDALVTEASKPQGSVGKLLNTMKHGHEFRELTDA